MEKEHLEEFRKFLAETKGLGQISQYRYCVWMREFDPNQISQDYINEYVQLKGNHSQIRGAMLNFLEYAGLKKVFDMPPKMTGRKRKRLIREITQDEIKILRDYLYRQSFKKGLVFDLIHQGALRRFEIPTIRINSFRWLDWIENMDKPCHLVIQGKGDKERTVLINPETAEMIFNHYNSKYALNTMALIMAWANSPSLLFSAEGKMITVHRVWSIIHKGSVKALGRDVRTHEVRHARATELERLGVPVQDIKNYLGHSSLATTEIYLHKSEKESIAVIEGLIQSKK